MKQFTLLSIVILLGCFQQCLGQAKQLTDKEIAQIKNDVATRAEKFMQDLRSLDHKGIMSFYANVKDFAVFGDGYYWGDYQTINDIWKDFTTYVKKVLKWDLINPKIYVFSKDAASCMVEFYTERIEYGGDTTKGHGCLSLGMQKIDGDWKAVTMNATHNYNVYDSTGAVRKWWLDYSPENRKKKE